MEEEIIESVDEEKLPTIITNDENVIEEVIPEEIPGTSGIIAEAIPSGNIRIQINGQDIFM